MGSYTYISICALLCYLFLFVTFIVAKRDQTINAFLMVLAALMCWVGGSFFMRSLFWPSMKFWYNVSILGLLAILSALNRFVRSFMGHRRSALDWALDIWVGIDILVNTLTGALLAAPEAIQQPGGEISFVYHPTSLVLVMYGVAVFGVVKIAADVIRYSISDAEIRRQFMPIVIGLLCLLFGNIIIMFPPFEGIPLDIVSGVVNAFCMFYMLYQRRLFKMTLLVSRRSCSLASATLVCIAFANWLRPFQIFIAKHFGMLADYDVLIVAVAYTLTTLLVSAVLKSLIDHVFIRDEQSQAKILEEFNVSVTKSLRMNEILEKLINVIQSAIGVSWVAVCTLSGRDPHTYIISYCSDPLEQNASVFTNDNPIVQWFHTHDEIIMMQDFHRLIEYRSMWDDEKKRLLNLKVRCMIPLREDDELIGILLLSGKEKNKKFTNSDESFLGSVKTVASIAIKNAALYEKAFHDARTDDLTGLLNRKYFYRTLESEFDRCSEHAVALIILNIDDFKLYNQLYGNVAGDNALKQIAAIIRSAVADNGYCARYSGKEFAVVLPNFDLLSAKGIAESIQKRVAALSSVTDSDYSMKALTMSIGVCASPYGAVTLKQLVNNTEQAVYHVKRNGKAGIKLHADHSVDFASAASSVAAQPPQDLQSVYSEYAPTIYALTAAIDTKDHYTFNHSKNVAYYATKLAIALGIDSDGVEIINEAALLHDVGKIGVPESILNKPDRLTDSEYVAMQKHVENSIGIIRHLPSLDYVIPAVIGHHERWDGRGYPRHISGQDIPLYARILCVADTFDAMTSDRIYRKSRPTEVALQIMQDQAGKQFDPKLADVFVREFRAGRIVLQKLPVSSVS